MTIKEYPTRKPRMTRELLNYLNETYPDVLPRGELSERDLAFKQGQRDVVDYLIQLYEQEE